MKKLLKHLQSIDPRITVKIYMLEEQYVLEAGIEGSFCGQVINKSLRKAKKKFFKDDSIVAVMKEVEVLHQYEAKIKEKKRALIKEQEDLLSEEFECLFQNTLETELEQLLKYVDIHNVIRSTMDNIIEVSDESIL